MTPRKIRELRNLYYECLRKAFTMFQADIHESQLKNKQPLWLIPFIGTTKFTFIGNLLLELEKGKTEKQIAKERNRTPAAITMRVKREKEKMKNFCRYGITKNPYDFIHSLSPKEAVVFLNQDNLSEREIAKKYSIPKSTVHRIKVQVNQKWGSFIDEKNFF